MFSVYCEAAPLSSGFLFKEGVAGVQRIANAQLGMSRRSHVSSTSILFQVTPLRDTPDRPALMKVHTRRPEGGDALVDAAILQRTINRLRRSALVPRGLHRFVTHEEADRWMTRQMAATHAHRSSKT